MKGCAAVALLFIAIADVAVAQVTHGSVWNAIGKTGSIDEADLSIYEIHDTGSLTIKRSVTSATLDVTYNVTGLPNVEPGFPVPEPEGIGRCVGMRAVLRDTGPGARVVVALKQLDLFRGTGITTLGVIDSNNPPGLASEEYFLFETCLNVPDDFQFEYGQFVYFIEAQLIKTTSGGNPGLRAVSVCVRTTMCFDD
jgi:hypothetical protein